MKIDPTSRPRRAPDGSGFDILISFEFPHSVSVIRHSQTS
jgi:hypothetical protein